MYIYNTYLSTCLFVLLDLDSEGGCLPDASTTVQPFPQPPHLSCADLHLQIYPQHIMFHMHLTAANYFPTTKAQNHRRLSKHQGDFHCKCKPLKRSNQSSTILPSSGSGSKKDDGPDMMLDMCNNI